MLIKKIYHKWVYYKAKQYVKKNASFKGNNHVFSNNSFVCLSDGARKEQVIIEDGAWMQGQIFVEGNGVVIMHEHSKIETSTRILCVNRVEIGAYTAIAEATICDNNNHPVSPEFRKKMRITPIGSQMRMWKYSDNKPIKIGENCWIGAGVRICKGVTIGDNSVIAACSVVTKNVPANCIAAGNPAKVVKTDIDKVSMPANYNTIEIDK